MYGHVMATLGLPTRDKFLGEKHEETSTGTGKKDMKDKQLVPMKKPHKTKSPATVSW